MVDRWNRRWIMVIADSVVALASIVLALLFLLDVVVFWHIYIVMFIRSLAGGFHGNAMNGFHIVNGPGGKADPDPRH